MRNTPTAATGTYVPPDLITYAWVINSWLIYANTHVLSPLMNTSVGTLKPDLVTTQLETNTVIKAANKYLPETIAMVVMDPNKAIALMRFIAMVFLNGLAAKADTRIDTSASRNFVSKECVMANGFYKDCKTAPKLDI